MKINKWLTFLVIAQLPVLATNFTVSNTLEFRQALEDASVNGENDTISLQPGIYNTSFDGMGTFTFNDTEEYNLTIKGMGNNFNDVILDGNKTDQVMNFTNNKNFTLGLENLSIINGYTDKSGGGIYTTSSVVMKDCNVSNNYSKNYGGAIYSSKDLNINNVFINQNKASRGGGIYCEKDLISQNSTINKNKSDYNGGGIFVKNILINDTTIKYNYSGSNGSGIYINSKGNIIDSKINYNEAFNGMGGGIYAGSDLYIKNSQLSYNNIANYGGAYSKNGKITVLNSDISYNRRGGVYAKKILIINSNFVGNYGYQGGAIIQGESIAVNSNFINNEMSFLRGVYVNNIFENSPITFTGDSKLYNNYIDYGNIEEDNHIIIKKSNLNPDLVGSINFAENNISLQSNSPLLDKGLNPTDDRFKKLFDDNTYQSIIQDLKTDYFGYTRIINNIIDIGASEYGATSAKADKPKITLNFSGNQKVYSPITVNFNIESKNPIAELFIDKGNGYEPYSTTLKSFTVTYNTPEQYNIKIKVIDDQGNISELVKTIKIYDMTTQEAIEYGKNICQNDPASCGISQTNSQQIDILDNEKFNDSSKGWKLLGVNRDIDTNTLLNKNNSISILWAYKNGQWFAKSKDTVINTQILNSNISVLDKLESGDGFWINTK